MILPSRRRSLSSIISCARRASLSGRAIATLALRWPAGRFGEAEGLVHLRRQRRSCRAAPGAQAADADLQHHAGFRAFDAHWTGEAVRDIAREIAGRKGLRDGEARRLLQRAPARVEGLEDDAVARGDGEHGRELAREDAVHRAGRRAEAMEGHGAA